VTVTEKYFEAGGRIEARGKLTTPKHSSLPPHSPPLDDRYPGIQGDDADETESLEAHQEHAQPRGEDVVEEDQRASGEGDEPDEDDGGPQPCTLKFVKDQREISWSKSTPKSHVWSAEETNDPLYADRHNSLQAECCSAVHR